MDIITYALAKNGANEAVDAAISALPKGIIYKGAVSYESDLPNTAEVGDCYTIKYSGSSGSNPDGREVVWGNYEGTAQWITLGASLPSVDASDNGKVLGVVDGAWAADENILNVTYANSKLSHTYAEIVAAIDSGKTVILTFNGIKYLTQYVRPDKVVFETIDAVNSMKVITCFVTSINTFGTNSVSFAPSPSTNDNGKVLVVKNGVWAADENSFVVTYDGTTADKTYAQIREAVLAGKNVYCVYGGMVYEFSGISNFGTSTTERINFASFNNSTQYYYLNFLITGQIYRGATSNIPSTTNSDNGKELIVINGSWAKQKKKFVVTLTPTSPDYSGTMDKTPQEITAAYNAGQKIVFDIPSMNAMVDADQYIASDVSVNNLRFGAKVFYDFNNAPVLITIITNGADDTQTYGTGIYSLTRAS